MTPLSRLGPIVNPTAGRGPSVNLKAARAAIDALRPEEAHTGPGALGAASLEGWGGRVGIHATDEDTGRAQTHLDEARHPARMHTQAGVIEAMRGLGPPLVVVKWGERGCAVISPDATWEVPAYHVTVSDTVGAGGGFVAGMLAGLCQGESVERAARRGARLS